MTLPQQPQDQSHAESCGAPPRQTRPAPRSAAWHTSRPAARAAIHLSTLLQYLAISTLGCEVAFPQKQELRFRCMQLPLVTPRIAVFGCFCKGNKQCTFAGSPQPGSPQAGYAPWTCATRCARAHAASARAAWGRSPGRSARSGPGTSQTAPADPRNGQPVRPMPPHDAAAAQVKGKCCRGLRSPLVRPRRKGR